MKYKLIENVINVEGKACLSYGIAVKGNAITNISCNKNEVKRLISLFNHRHLSAIHFGNAVEDYLEACQ